MNEITRIHLGRVPFTIAVQAHKSLKAYLADIAKKVDDEDVMNEVELRISELFTERGITSEKVILPEDVAYIEEQLGSPDAFLDDTPEAELPTTDDKQPKRLFRDTDTAIISGVASGLSKYSGLDPTLIRLLFIVFTVFSAGIGIAVYLVLWLTVPAAETTSERLQMQGKPVTLEALKESVSNADINGAAKRVNNKILAVVNSIFRVVVKLMGVGFVLGGLGILGVLSTIKIYMLMHNNRLFQENLFPVGTREQWLLNLGVCLMALLAVFILLFGIAIFKRAWPIKAWVTGTLIGLFMLGSVGVLALGADVAPRIRDRYETTVHTTAVNNISQFSSIETNGSIDIEYISSPTYGANIHYVGNPDISKVKVQVVNNVLHIDSTALDNIHHCTMLCLFPGYDMTVQVYAPTIEKFTTPPRTDIFYPNVPPAPLPNAAM